MKRICLAAALLVLIGTAWAWSQSARPPRGSGVVAVEKWEYTTLGRAAFPSLQKQVWAGKIDGNDVPAAGTIHDALNMAGNAGWELVSIVAETGKEPSMTTYYFKRQIH